MFFTKFYHFLSCRKVSTTEGSEEPIVTGVVYLCDFDANDNCGGTLFANNSGFSHAFSASIQSQVMVSTTVTDYTSISEFIF
jgi:hypothetical protein